MYKEFQSLSCKLFENLSTYQKTSMLKGKTEAFPL